MSDKKYEAILSEVSDLLAEAISWAKTDREMTGSDMFRKVKAWDACRKRIYRYFGRDLLQLIPSLSIIFADAEDEALREEDVDIQHKQLDAIQEFRHFLGFDKKEQELKKNNNNHIVPAMQK